MWDYNRVTQNNLPEGPKDPHIILHHLFGIMMVMMMMVMMVVMVMLFRIRLHIALSGLL